MHWSCKTLQYTEPLLASSPRGPAEPTGLPDNLLTTLFCQVLPVHYPGPEHEVYGNGMLTLVCSRPFGVITQEWS